LPFLLKPFQHDFSARNTASELHAAQHVIVHDVAGDSANEYVTDSRCSFVREPLRLVASCTNDSRANEVIAQAPSEALRKSRRHRHMLGKDLPFVIVMPSFSSFDLNDLSFKRGLGRAGRRWPFQLISNFGG